MDQGGLLVPKGKMEAKRQQTMPRIPEKPQALHGLSPAAEDWLKQPVLCTRITIAGSSHPNIFAFHMVLAVVFVLYVGTKSSGILFLW